MSCLFVISPFIGAAAAVDLWRQSLLSLGRSDLQAVRLYVAVDELRCGYPWHRQPGRRLRVSRGARTALRAPPAQWADYKRIRSTLLLSSAALWAVMVACLQPLLS
jgi:hypothetical protein